MVYINKEGNGQRAAWFDGKLPSKKDLLSQCSPQQLSPVGLNGKILKELELELSGKSHKTDRRELMIFLAAAFVKSHISCLDDRRKNYQIVMLHPKWKKGNKPPTIQNAETNRYDAKRFFAEDDPIFKFLPEQQILHLRPYIRYLRDGDYFQLLAVYPASSNDWNWDHVSGMEFPSKGPISELAYYAGIDTPSDEKYHNFPILHQQLTMLLREAIRHHVKREPLAAILKEREFEILGEKVSFEIGTKTSGHCN